MATSLNFYQPGTEAAVEANSLLRQRELAKMLMQQSQSPQQGQNVGGVYVAPSKLSYVGQLAQALTGSLANQSADEKELALGHKLQAQRTAEAQAFMQAANGTPGQPARSIQPLTANDDEGNPMPVAQSAATPAVPGDMNKALAIALGGQNPQLQAMAPEILKRQMADASFQQALQSAGGGSGGMASGGATNPAGANTGGPAPVGGGNTFGLNPAAFALSQSSDPRAAALAKMIQENSKPITLGEAGTLIDPVTRQPIYTAPKTEAGIGVAPIAGSPGQFQANPVQGYAEAKARAAGLIAGEEASARDPYAGLVRVDTPNGPRMMTPAQARAAAGAGSPAPSPAPGAVGNGGGPVNGQPTANPMAPRPGDTDRGMIYKQELDAAAQRLSAAKQAGDPAAVARAEQDIGALLKEVKSNKIQMPQEGPSAGAGRGAQGGPGIPLQTEQSQAYATSRAKSYAEIAPKLQQAGQDAASSLRNLDALETLYKDPNVAKGALAENISGLKNLGASFGIEMKGLSSEQAAEAITNKMALASRSTADGGGMPGAMSDADRKFLANMQPGLTKTPEGRAKIIDASRKVAQRQLDVANLAREYEQKNGQLDLGFDRMLADYAAKNQMFTQPTKGGGFKIIGVQ